MLLEKLMLNLIVTYVVKPSSLQMSEFSNTLSEWSNICSVFFSVVSIRKFSSSFWNSSCTFTLLPLTPLQPASRISDRRHFVFSAKRMKLLLRVFLSKIVARSATRRKLKLLSWISSSFCSDDLLHSIKHCSYKDYQRNEWIKRSIPRKFERDVSSRETIITKLKHWSKTLSFFLQIGSSAAQLASASLALFPEERRNKSRLPKRRCGLRRTWCLPERLILTNSTRYERS